MRTVACTDQLRGHQQDALAQGLKGCVVKFLRQAQSLEPVDEIVGEQEQMEIGFVGKEMMCRNGAECIVAFALSNEKFDAGAVVVEAPKVQRLQLQIVTNT